MRDRAGELAGVRALWRERILRETCDRFAAMTPSELAAEMAGLDEPLVVAGAEVLEAMYPAAHVAAVLERAGMTAA